MSVSFKQAVMLAIAMGLSACAGPNQDPPLRINVSSTPAGATCQATRDDQLIGRIAATPSWIRVTNAASTIVVSCEAPGHMTGRSLVVSYVDGSSVAPYLFVGGVVGLGVALAVASASGTIFTYQSDVEVTLAPQVFTTAEERDVFFDGVIARIRQQAEGQTSTALFDAEITRLDGLRQAVGIAR